MGLGEPFIRARGLSGYWLYAELFSSTCPVMIDQDNSITGAVIAFRSQDNPAQLYVQDVMIHPEHRRRAASREPYWTACAPKPKNASAEGST